MRQVAVNPRHAQVRIRGGVAVTRKMLGGRQHAAFMRPFDVGSHKLPHLLRIFAKRTSVNHRIRRIGIDVRHREKIPVNANGPRFLSSNPPEGLCIVEFPRRPKCHGMRKNRGPIQAHAQAPLEIGGKQQWQFRLLLQMIQYHRRFIRLTLDEEPAIRRNRHRKPAHVVLVDDVPKLRIRITVIIQKLRPHPHHEQLPDFLFSRQLAQSFLRPFLPIAIKMNRPGLLEVLFGKQQRHHQEHKKK